MLSGSKNFITGRALRIAAGITVLVLLLAGSAAATDDNLPGGTSISVDITAPSDGAVVPPGDLQLIGTASMGEGIPSADTLIVYVLDVSGSTNQSGGCGGDQNGDGYADYILDCEIAAAKALNAIAVTTGTVGEVGVVVFASYGKTGDVDPAVDDQLITGPDTDADSDGIRDVEEVLSSAFSGGNGGLSQFTSKTAGYGTDFHDGLMAVMQVIIASSKPNKIIVFMSDGKNTEGYDIHYFGMPGIKIHTFAIGSESSCHEFTNWRGDLADIADNGDSGSSCTEVQTLSDLPTVVPGLIKAEFLSLEHNVDGGSFEAIPNSDIITDAVPDIGLPAIDPVTATFSHWVNGIAPGAHTLCVKANGSDGGGSGEVSDCINIIVNQPPVAEAGGPYPVDEGSSVTVDGSGSSDPDVGDTLKYEWDLNNDGTYETPGVTAILTPLDDLAPLTVGLQVSDGNGGTGTDTATITVNNVAPVVDAGADATINEAGTFTSSGSFTDPGADTWTATVDYGDGSGVQALTLAGKTFSLSHVYADNGAYTVTVKVTDDDLGSGSDTSSVTVNNVVPSVGTITAPIDPQQTGISITASAPFTDPGTSDIHTAVWNWGDGTTGAGTVTETSGSGSATGSHAYTAAGIYTVTLTVTDDEGGAGSAAYEYVVVYDPGSGFVTGGGWINSPQGAYTPDPALTGKANFGFNSKYQKGASIPTGTTEFQFKTASFNFHSTSYEWLVIAGARAQFKGTGTINGAGNYGFMLTGIDGQVNGDGGDKFRIKIWDMSTGNTIYDNQMGDTDTIDPTTTIAGGSIAIHK